MLKTSFIYFGASVITLLVVVAIFILCGVIIGPSFWEYSILMMPLLFVPSIILSIIGTRYARKARRDVKDSYSLLSVVSNIIFLVCLLIVAILILLFNLLVLSFAG